LFGLFVYEGTFAYRACQYLKQFCVHLPSLSIVAGYRCQTLEAARK
jgi:hypothetical protein